MTYSARDGFLQLLGLYGSPNRTGASNLCHVPRSIAFNDAFGGRPGPDFANSNLVIFWASNPVNTTRFTGYTTCNGFNQIIPSLKSRGAKIIVIDAVRAEIVHHADNWVRPNLGTDTALGLAMAHTIIEEEIYDQSFVGQWLLQFDEIKRHVSSFTTAWAEKMGLGQYYPFQNSEEWINYALQPAGTTVNDLRRQGIVFATPSITYHKYQKGAFGTRSGKIECYSEQFQNAGRGALPGFEPPIVDTASDAGWKKFNLIATSRRPAELVHTKLANLPTPGRSDLEPFMKINSLDAQTRGIREGDRVEVESCNGKIQLKAVVTHDLVPGLVSIDFGWGNPTDNKASMNILTRDDIWDPVSGGYPNRYTPCEVKKSD